MGKAKRMRPKRLGEKLLKIRNCFGDSLSQLAERMSDTKLNISRTALSAYELNDSEPPLPVLLKFARIANIYVEVLIDDEMDLPTQIPAPKKEPI